MVRNEETTGIGCGRRKDRSALEFVRHAFDHIFFRWVVITF
jgi:hypothetical protein